MTNNANINALQNILESVLPQMENGKFSNVERFFLRGLVDQLKSNSGLYETLKHSCRHLKEAQTETEVACNSILEIAAQLQSNESTEEIGIKLAEACTFQDIVGQRLKKVQQTLDQYFDLLLIYSANEASTSISDHDNNLMSGPGFQGENISQDEADRLMG